MAKQIIMCSCPYLFLVIKVKLKYIKGFFYYYYTNIMLLPRCFFLFILIWLVI